MYILAGAVRADEICTYQNDSSYVVGVETRRRLMTIYVFLVFYSNGCLTLRTNSNMYYMQGQLLITIAEY